MNYEEIEAEFDKRLPELISYSEGIGQQVSVNSLKAFYREKLQQAEQQGAERAVEYIRGEIPKVNGEEVHKLELNEILNEAAKHPSSSKEESV